MIISEPNQNQPEEEKQAVKRLYTYEDDEFVPIKEENFQDLKMS